MRAGSPQLLSLADLRRAARGLPLALQQYIGWKTRRFPVVQHSTQPFISGQHCWQTIGHLHNAHSCICFLSAPSLNCPTTLKRPDIGLSSIQNRDNEGSCVTRLF